MNRPPKPYDFRTFATLEAHTNDPEHQDIEAIIQKRQTALIEMVVDSLIYCGATINHPSSLFH